MDRQRNGATPPGSSDLRPRGLEHLKEGVDRPNGELLGPVDSNLAVQSGREDAEEP
jgi:hypothetical protein